MLESRNEKKNFVVGLAIRPEVNKKIIEINSIRNVFPKDNAEWLNWITKDLMLYGNVEKIKALISEQRMILADVSYLDLNSVAKVLNNFGLDTTNSGKNSENLQGGEDVRFRVAPSGYSADRYTTKEGKKVGFSSRLGKLRPLEK